MNVKQEIMHEKLQKIGDILKKHREYTYQETRKKFATRLSNYLGAKYSWRDIYLIEQGSKNTPIYKIVGIWMYLQSIDNIIVASEQKELMFLSRQIHNSEIEGEITKFFNQGKK